MQARLCQLCGRCTFRSDAICRGCEPLPVFGTGTYPCCGGLGEHFESCATGAVIARARRAIARAGVRR